MIFIYVRTIAVWGDNSYKYGILFIPVPDTPNVTVNTDTTSISLSLSNHRDSVVTSYYVTWESDACPGVDDAGRTTLFATDYVIYNRRGGTSYTITAHAVNSAGNSSTTTVTATTQERSE